MNFFGLSFVLFILKWSADNIFYVHIYKAICTGGLHINIFIVN